MRALAILPVVGFHAFPKYFPGGYIGVDIFFVISGYLITGIILRELNNGYFGILDFYRRRILRLFPALTVTLLATWIAGVALLYPSDLKTLGRHITASGFFLQNFNLLQESGYFDTSSELKPLLHLWSLAVEEQYYLLTPIILIAAWRKAGLLLLALAALFIVSAVLMLEGATNHPTSTFYLLHTRAWELMAGAILATLQHNGIVHFSETTPSLARDGVSWFAVALLAGSVLLLKPGDWPNAQTLIPVAAAVLLIGSGSSSAANRLLLSRKPLVLIGLISYPLYLWHWPILAYLRVIEVGGMPPRSWRIVAVLAAFALAYTTWRWLEIPIRRRGEQIKTITALLFAMAACIGIGLITTWRDGWPERLGQHDHYLDKKLQALSERPGAPENQDKGCLQSFRPPVDPKYQGIIFCKQTSTASPDVLLIGDSHAVSLYPGLSEWLSQRGINLKHIGGSGTAPLLDFANRGIDDAIDILENRKLIARTTLTFAFDSQTPRIIVMASRWPWHYESQGFGDVEGNKSRVTVHDHLPTDASPSEKFTAAVYSTLQALKNANKTVIVVLDNPELDFHPKACLPKPYTWLTEDKSKTDCSIDRKDVERRQHGYRSVFRQAVASFSNVILVDAMEPLCDAERCYAMKDGELLYYDDDHLSMAGARLVAAHIGPVIEKLVRSHVSESPPHAVDNNKLPTPR
ncbi:acyltransferase family protein [Tepidimonas sp.]|uniref:acyltransferase family protein n=1 Tax=Tepidimonas sp. TaxID=2002775 RepID=UPI00391CF63B